MAPRLPWIILEIIIPETQILKSKVIMVIRKANLEKYDENAIDYYASQLQPIPAMAAAETCPEWRNRIV